MKFKEVKLEELCNIQRGASPRPIKDYIVEKGIPWVKIADATADSSRYIWKTKEFIKEEGKSKSRPVIKGDLILSNSATPGLPKIMKIDACVHDGWLLLRDFKGVSKEYLYYVLINKRRELVNNATGTVFNNLKTDTVKNFKIQLPNKRYQEKITNILQCLDEKIELNNSIISNLEELAQTLFKHWFVDFEFPNENGEPYKSSGGKMVESELGMIPEGWEVKSLSDIASFQNGLAMQRYRPALNEESLPVLKIKELRQGFTNNDSDRCSIDIKDSVKVFNGDVIFSWSASLLVKLWVGGNAGLNQHLFKVTSDDYPKWFYYMWTKHYLDEFNAIAKDKATTMGHIKRSHLNESKVLIPTEKKLTELTSIFNPLISKKIKTVKENNKLEKIRDTLLPKLLSGEIELPESMEVTDDVPIS